MGASQSVCELETESCGSVAKIGEGFTSALSHSLGRIQGEVLRQTRSYKEIAGLSYEEFLQDIAKLNEISGQFLDSNGKRLVFAVKKGTDTTALWKGTVKVACVKLDAETNQVDSFRLLNLKQFLAVYKSLQTQSQAVTKSSLPDCGSGCGSGAAETAGATARPHPLSLPAFSHSQILDEALEGTSLEECCVCLERKPDVILPCAHSYCSQCIQQWNVNHKTCPVCRETVESTEDGWVISDGPDSLDITTEIQKSLMELAHE